MMPCNITLLLIHLANVLYSYYGNWKKYNESFVKRDKILTLFRCYRYWDYELAQMNKGKYD